MLRNPTVQTPTHQLIQDGDLVVVYERFDSMKAQRVDSRKTFNNKFGHFDMQSWVGMAYGSRAAAKAPSSGWVYLLRPTPELWTKVLLHRTQILYAADISLICTFLELRPGAAVVECGTGSGSLTHALARAVAPTGHVHTFEFHEQRATLASQEFAEHGLSGVVSVRQRDVEATGFPDSLHDQADAVFLDVPGPWKAVPSAALCLKPNAVLATFSPCIEQVQKTRAAMAACGFWDVRVLECLLREHEVRKERMVSDLDASSQGMAPSSSGATRKRKHRSNTPHTANESGTDAAVQSMVVSRPVMEARGHTGYMVFARKAVSGTGAMARVADVSQTEDPAADMVEQRATASAIENG